MKRVGVIVAVLLVVVAMAGIAVPILISSDFVKQRIVHRIAGITGRKVTIIGKPTLAVYPHLAVTADGLTIANPHGMPGGPFVVAESLHASLRILPLLLGHVEFNGFELVRPTIHLAVDGEGRPNWLIRNVAAIVPEAASQPVSPAPAPPTEGGLGEIAISDGTVLYDDVPSKTREQMTAVNVDLTWPNAAAPIGGRGTLQWRGETIEFTGTAAAPMSLLAGGESAVHFAIGSTPVRLSFDGEAGAGVTLRLDGDATASTPSLRRAIEWLGTPMGAGSILGAASIAGAMSVTGRTINFNKATIELDGNSAEGALGVDLGGAKPAIQGTLAFTALDLSAYIDAARAGVTADGTWLIAPARLPLADAIDADLRLSAGAVTTGTARVMRATATVVIKNSTVDLALAQADFQGGTFSADLKTQQDSDALAGTLHMRLADMPATVLAAVAGASPLAGTADTDFTVGSRGRSWAELANAVTGSGKIAVRDGTLTGFDLTKIPALLSDALAPPVAASGDTTHFAGLEATLSLAGGELHTDDLTMEGDGFHLSLAGGGSVLSGSVDAAGRIAAGNADVPVAIGGTWHAPVVETAATAQ